MPLPPRPPTLLPLLLAALTCAGCVTGERHRYAARAFGPMSDRVLPRSEWPASLQARCSAAPAAGDLPRAPYVQRTRTDATEVLWRSDAPAASERIRYWRAGEDAETHLAQGADMGPGWTARQASLVDLEPGATHCYQLERDGEIVAGPYAFDSAPDDLDATVDLVAFGDSGTAWEEQYAVFDQIQTVRSDLIVHTGDVAYDSGTDVQLQETVFDVYGPLLRSVPFFPSLGNHDLETEDGAPFRRAFELPDVGEPGGHERFYSFDWGPVHFVALDSTDRLAAQVEWLDADLAATTRPWIVVYLHDPPYSGGRHGSDTSARRMLAPILARHRVPLVLSGHDHHYERSHEIEGTVYIVTGGGGRQISHVSPEAHTAFADSVLHFVQVHFEGRRAWLYAIDATGQVFDSALLETHR